MVKRLVLADTETGAFDGEVEQHLKDTFVSSVIVTGAGVDYSGVTDSTTAVQSIVTAAGDDCVVEYLPGELKISNAIVPRAGQKHVGRATRIVQSSLGKPVFDVLDRPGVTIDSFACVGGATRTFGGSSARGDNAYTLYAAVWTNSDGTTIRNVTAENFTCGVSVSPWNGTNITSRRVQGFVIEGLTVDDVDFGVLAKGVDNYRITGVRGSSSLTPSSTNPSHLIYFSSNNSTTSRNGVISDASAVDCADSYAYQFKGVEGLTLTNLSARGCGGLLSLFTSSDISGKGLVSVGDIAGSNGSVYIADSAVLRTDLEVQVQKANEARVVRVDGVDVSVKVKATVTHTAFGSDMDVFVTGTRSSVDAEIVNTDTQGGWRAVGLAAAAVSAVVRLRRAVNVAQGVNVPSGATGAVVEFNPASVIPCGLAGGNFRAASISEATATYARANRTLATSGNGATVTPEVSAYGHYLITTTGASNVVLANPRTDSRALGAQVRVTIVNASGGAMGTITWQADYALRGALTAPANGARVSLLFEWDGTAWQEVARTV